MLWKISMSQRLKKCGTIYNHTFGFALNTGQNGPEKKKKQCGTGAEIFDICSSMTFESYC